MQRFFLKGLPVMVVVAVLLISAAASGQDKAAKTFHDFRVETITGETLDLSSFRGKKVMVVNTASKCGFTPQYEVLEELYQKYDDQGFVVIGFPANNFNNQEPGSNEEIMDFCQSTFQVTFPMMSKISVKGEDQAPVYQWLTNKEYNGKMDAEVAWNFQKFLIDEQGQLVDYLPPRESPMSERVIQWIEEE